MGGAHRLQESHVSAATLAEAKVGARDYGRDAKVRDKTIRHENVSRLRCESRVEARREDQIDAGFGEQSPLHSQARDQEA